MFEKPPVPIRPKLMFFGDPHGDFRFVVRSVECHRPEAIVLLGDLQPRRPLQIELAPVMELTSVWFVHGNHDTDSESGHDHLFGSTLADRNLHGHVVEVAGLRFAGVGGVVGVFRQSIWVPSEPPAFRSVAKRLRSLRPCERWRGGLPLRHRSSIFPDVFERLARQRADVPVSHEALGGHTHGWPVLDALATSLGVQVAAHGHLHQNIDYVAEGRLPRPYGYQAYGVDRECFLTWPRTVRHFERAIP